jgi:uncharacterized damage-inducible protein DinB
MSGPALMRTMARNNAWANAVLHDACRALPENAWAAPYPSFFGSIPATMDHILTVDLYYLDGLEAGGLGRAVFDRTELTQRASLFAAQAEADTRLMRFCDGLSGTDLSALRVIERPDGPTEERVAAILLHLFQHQIHHRGQVHALLSLSGTDPPQLDDFHLEWGRVDSARRFWAAA